MADTDFRQGPASLHPEEPSAVGSRNSLNRDGRDEYVESRLIIDEEVDKILNHINAKLPPEVLQDLNVMGNVKSHLHTYFNQSLQNMLNRYLTSTEDEMGKKLRDFVDKEEHQNLNRYTPREIAGLLTSIGGSDIFNTEEVEKSMVNIMGHLQGHVQRGTYDFENRTTDILMQNTDVGGFVRGKNTYAVVKCSFRDNHKKPDKVIDIKLAINILDEELISPIVSHQMASEHLVKEVIAKHIHGLIEREIDEINQQLAVESRPELSPAESIIEKIKAVENYTDDDDSDSSKRYQLLPRHFLDKLRGMSGDITEGEFDVLGVREGIANLLESEGLRTRGWNTAMNSITGILDNGRMGYQYSQNYKNARHMVLREYEETDLSRLPDERFEIELKYYDARQIQEEKVAYKAQLMEFKREIMRLWDLTEQVYLEERDKAGKMDWEILKDSTIYRDRQDTRKGFFGSKEEGAVVEERVWNEITFVRRVPTSLEELNQTYENEIHEYQRRLTGVRKKMSDTFGMEFPDHRLLIEGRLNFLENQFLAFMAQVNPFHIQPGMVLDLSLSSIKRKKVTILGMGNMLNEFLLATSKGFVDVAMAHHEKRRSHTGSVDDDFGGK